MSYWTGMAAEFQRYPSIIDMTIWVFADPQTARSLAGEES